MKKNLDGKTMPLLAAGAGLAVANTYYSQPMLAELSIAFGTTPAVVAAIPMAALTGNTLGVIFLAPLGDKFERRALIVLTTVALALGLLGASIAACGSHCAHCIQRPSAWFDHGRHSSGHSSVKNDQRRCHGMVGLAGHVSCCRRSHVCNGAPLCMAIAKGPSESNSELCRVAGIAMATASRAPDIADRCPYTSADLRSLSGLLVEPCGVACR